MLLQTEASDFSDATAAGDNIEAELIETDAGNDAPVFTDNSHTEGTVVEDATIVMDVEGDSIITNGGFESGNLDGWIVDGDAGAVAVAGGAASGEFSASVQPTSNGTLLTQNVAIKDDGRYLVRFSLQGGSADSTVSIMVGGMSIFTLDNAAYPDATPISLEISASEEFSGVGLSFQGSGAEWHFDDFEVVPLTAVEVIPDAETTAGTLEFADADLEDIHTIAVAPRSAEYVGTFTTFLTDSTGTGTGYVDWDFSVENDAIAFLSDGESLTQTYDVTLDDGHGGTVTRAVTVTIDGSGNANESPVAVDDAAQIQEDAASTVAGNVLDNDSDPDAGTLLSVTNAGQFQGKFGTLTLSADGSYAYALDEGAVQHLGQGQTASDSFGYAISDNAAGNPLGANAVLTIQVEGSNDAPIAHADAVSAQEDGGPVTLAAADLLANDTDADGGDSKTIVAVSESASGAGVAIVDGNIVYAPGTHFQSLRQGATAIDSFTYTMMDGSGAQSSAAVAVTVTGVNDAPVLAVPIADQSIKSGSAFSLTLGAAFADIDAGDTLAYSSSLANGDALPSWLVFNPLTKTFSGTPRAGDAGNLVLRVNATDSAGASVFDEFALMVTAPTGKTIIGTNCNDTLYGTGFNDVIDGRDGADIMRGGRGDDKYYVDSTCDVVKEYAGQGVDTIFSAVTYDLPDNVENITLLGSASIGATGNALDNLLTGNQGRNALAGGAGNDILQGLAGNDVLSDSSGRTLFDGGTGNDAMTGNSSNEMFIGGIGNDTITTGAGADIIAFNAGDGQDVVNASTGADNVLSLGGGIQYADLRLSKSGTSLILKTGGTDQITFKNWYSGSSNHSIAKLQVFTEAMPGYDQHSANSLLDDKAEQFNFAALASAFDTAGQVSGWTLTNALLSAHLSGSDSAALGGDLAHEFGKNGSLTGIGLTAAQDVLKASQFGSGAQTLRPIEDLQQGPIRLA